MVENLVGHGKHCTLTQRNNPVARVFCHHRHNPGRFGTLSILFSFLQYRRTENQLRGGNYQPTTLLTTVLTGVIFLISILFFICAEVYECNFYAYDGHHKDAKITEPCSPTS